MFDRIEIQGDAYTWTLDAPREALPLDQKVVVLTVSAPLSGTMLLSTNGAASVIALPTSAQSPQGRPTGWIMGDASYLYLPSPVAHPDGPKLYELRQKSDIATVGLIKNALAYGTQVNIELDSGSMLYLNGANLLFVVIGVQSAAPPVVPPPDPATGQVA
jgi:hypothetical protein